MSLQQLIDRFLVERREPVGGGWPEVTDGDLVMLRKIIEHLVRTKWGTDMDGEAPVSVRVIDKTRSYMRYYRAIPRMGDDPERALDAALTNLSISLDEVRTLMDLIGMAGYKVVREEEEEEGQDFLTSSHR